MPRSSWVVSGLLLVLLGGALAAPRGRKPLDEDKVALAGLLVREGDWDRAAQVLAEVDVARPGTDLGRYYTLSGLVALRARQAEPAVSAFQAALQHSVEGRELLQLHLARAQLLADRPEQALQALNQTGEVGAGMSGSWLLRAEAHGALGDWDAAFLALEQGSARLPDQRDLPRQQVLLLVKLGLFREARERGEALLTEPGATTDDTITIAEALRRSGDLVEARTLLEAALLSRPDDRDLLVQAARAAIDDGDARSAGRFLERAAILDPALALEAAEAYRRGGDLEAALRLNGEVADPHAKARQRLGLLLEDEAFDRAVALEERLTRLGLDTDDSIAYGLAYAWFRLGVPAEAERWLSGISDPKVFVQANALREAMAGCDPVRGCR